MEALGKSCFQEGFTPLEIPVVAARSEWRNISNGVNIVSYCALASAYHRPVRGYDLASMYTLCRTAFAVFSFKFRNPCLREAASANAGEIRIPQSKISPCLPICSWVSPSRRPLRLCVENGLRQSSSSRLTFYLLLG